MDALFASFNASLDAQQARKDEVSANAEKVHACARQAKATLERLHSTTVGSVLNANDASFAALLSDAKRDVEAAAAALVATRALIDKHAQNAPALAFSVRKSISHDLSSLVASLQLLRFVERASTTTDEAMSRDALLLTREEAERQLLGATTTTDDDAALAFRIELEDYLYGLFELPALLSRLAVTSTVRGDVQLIPLILAFCTDLVRGAGLLNLKNDNLRRKVRKRRSGDMLAVPRKSNDDSH